MLPSAARRAVEIPVERLDQWVSDKTGAVLQRRREDVHGLKQCSIECNAKNRAVPIAGRAIQLAVRSLDHRRARSAMLVLGKGVSRVEVTRQREPKDRAAT